MFDRPLDIQHLLRNIKLAMDKDLLLQPGFFTDANLLKFFNGTRMKWSTPSPHMEGMTWRRFEVTTDRRVFPKVTVELLRSCELIPAYTSASGAVPARITAVASVDLPVDDVPASVKFFVKLDSPAALAAGARSREIGQDNQIKSIHLWSRER